MFNNLKISIKNFFYNKKQSILNFTTNIKNNIKQTYGNFTESAKRKLDNKYVNILFEKIDEFAKKNDQLPLIYLFYGIVMWRVSKAASQSLNIFYILYTPILALFGIRALNYYGDYNLRIFSKKAEKYQKDLSNIIGKLDPKNGKDEYSGNLNNIEADTSPLKNLQDTTEYKRDIKILEGIKKESIDIIHNTKTYLTNARDLTKYTAIFTSFAFGVKFFFPSIITFPATLLFGIGALYYEDNRTTRILAKFRNIENDSSKTTKKDLFLNTNLEINDKNFERYSFIDQISYTKEIFKVNLSK